MKAREKSHEILCEVILKGQYANLLLRKELHMFSEADKHLITQIVYGTMQNYRYVRYQWERWAAKKLPESLAILMDMSMYQLIFMDKLPDYAIVSEAVEIAKKKSKGHYSAVINALLRRFGREGTCEVLGDKTEKLAVMTSHESWLVKMWVSQYGYEITEKICNDNQKIPLQTCRVNTLKTTADDILLTNPFFRKGQLSKDALIYEKGNIADTQEFINGLITIQDEASQCAALLLDPKENEVILDACAAPGTKTTHLAQLMKNQGKIIALDIHEHRVKLIENSCRRLNIQCIEAKQMDAAKCHESFCEEFDRILVDAPCSGYGVLKRKNDIKVHMRPTDMDEIIPLQASILNSVSHLVKKGGVLVYSTCTLNKKENEKQIEKFLKEHSDFECEKMQTLFGYEYHSDSFFMAKLVRK